MTTGHPVALQSLSATQVHFNHEGGKLKCITVQILVRLLIVVLLQQSPSPWSLTDRQTEEGKTEPSRGVMHHIQTSQASKPSLSMPPLQLAESNNVSEATPVVVHRYVCLWLFSVQILGNSCWNARLLNLLITTEGKRIKMHKEEGADLEQQLTDSTQEGLCRGELSTGILSG